MIPLLSSAATPPPTLSLSHCNTLAPICTPNAIGIQVNVEMAASDSDCIGDGHFDPEEVLPYHVTNPDVLRHVESAGRSLLSLLSSTCPLGFSAVPPGPKTLLRYVQGQKVSLSGPNKMPPICLVKVGDFYETFGLDSLILISHGGLNSMGGKLRAGMPLGNIQQVVDRLFLSWQGTGEEALEIAVFEEVGFVEGENLKRRRLQQVLRKGEEEYLFMNHMREGTVGEGGEGVRLVIVRETRGAKGPSYDLIEVDPWINRAFVSRNLPACSVEAIVGEGNVYKDTVWFQGGERPSWGGEGWDWKRVEGGTDEVIIDKVGRECFADKVRRLWFTKT